MSCHLKRIRQIGTLVLVLAVLLCVPSGTRADYFKMYIPEKESAGSGLFIVVERSGVVSALIIDAPPKKSKNAFMNGIDFIGSHNPAMVVGEISHSDFDHYSCFVLDWPRGRAPPLDYLLVSDRRVKTRPRSSEKPGYFELFEDNINSRGIKRITPQSPVMNKLKHDLGLEVFGVADPNAESWSSNDASLVTMIEEPTTGSIHITVGDLTETAWDKEVGEQVISYLEKRGFSRSGTEKSPLIRSLELSHHGGELGAIRMISTLRPQTIYCQSNRANRYGHPIAAVILGIARLGVDEEIQTLVKEYNDICMTQWNRLIPNSETSAQKSNHVQNVFNPIDKLDVRKAVAASYRLQEIRNKIAKAIEDRGAVGEYSYEDVLIGARRGDITYANGEFRCERNPSLERRFHEEMRFHEARMLDDEYLGKHLSWSELEHLLDARLYLRYLELDDTHTIGNIMAKEIIGRLLSEHTLTTYGARWRITESKEKLIRHLARWGCEYTRGYANEYWHDGAVKQAREVCWFELIDTKKRSDPYVQRPRVKIDRKSTYVRSPTAEKYYRRLRYKQQHQKGAKDRGYIKRCEDIKRSISKVKR